MVEAAIHRALSDYQTLRQKVGDRIYAAKAPPGAPDPLIIYQAVGTRFDRTMAGYKIVGTLVQVKAYDVSYQKARLLTDDVARCISQMSGNYDGVLVSGAFLVSQSVSWEPESQAYVGLVEATVWTVEE